MKNTGKNALTYHGGRVDFETVLAPILPLVQMPGRYTGGEYGSIEALETAYVETETTFGKAAPEEVLVAVAFPDLYEIGMSNLAIKLLYRELNRFDGVRCERVFSPAPDFEEELKSRGIPLFSLESGIPLRDFDLLGVSVGYELAATNILTLLELGGIPIDRGERGDNDPLVIAGGPALTNPAPFAGFFDGIYVGEGEEIYHDLVSMLKKMKAEGAGRDERMDFLRSHPSVWTQENLRKGTKAVRSLWREFDSYREGMMPVPNVDVVQDHGVVEIMRGCPNGCRFCHAGILYRPYRRKSYETIIREVDFLIHRLGYREITLSSLSSGDFSGLGPLVRYLNRRYAAMGVSFALPSLRIDSFTLPLLQEISHVRKSGLTFAVETPKEQWQKRVNKPVPLEKVAGILEEARRRGWNMAKFYFMIGLPPQIYAGCEDNGGFAAAESSTAEVNEERDETSCEANAIVEYLSEVRGRSGFKINANIGTFIPKPHTPYQWSRQLDEESSLARIRMIRDAFKRSPVRIAYHSPFISLLEGVISRGDERVGELIVDAYRRGARLDAWEEHLSVELWREVFRDADWDVEAETCRARSPEETLPWDSVDLGVSREFLFDEWQKSESGETSGACAFPCGHHCGVCVYGLKPEEGADELPDDEFAEEPKMAEELRMAEQAEPAASKGGQAEGRWFLFEFRKKGRARFLSHINIMTIFERSFQRAGVLLEYTRGYNPKPRIEFAHPLSLGIESEAEICRAKISSRNSGSKITSAADTTGEISPEELLRRLEGVFPEGIRVTRICEISPELSRGKGKSLMSRYAGSVFHISPADSALFAEAEAQFARLGEEELDKGFAPHLIEDIEEERGDAEMLELRTAGSGQGGKLLKDLMNSYGGPGEFLSRYRVQRKSMRATGFEEAQSRDENRSGGSAPTPNTISDYFTIFTKCIK